MLADGPGLGDRDGLSIVTEFYKINGLLRRSRTDGVWLSYENALHLPGFLPLF